MLIGSEKIQNVLLGAHLILLEALSQDLAPFGFHLLGYLEQQLINLFTFHSIWLRRTAFSAFLLSIDGAWIRTYQGKIP